MAPAGRPRRVVISTHTIALQEQLITKDIPLVAAVMPVGRVMAVDRPPVIDRAADEAFFESRIRPLLHDHCLECHAAGAEGGDDLVRSELVSGG